MTTATRPIWAADWIATAPRSTAIQNLRNRDQATRTETMASALYLRKWAMLEAAEALTDEYRAAWQAEADAARAIIDNNGGKTQ